MNPDLGLRRWSCLEVLKGLKSEVEHVSESTYMYHRGLGSSVGLYISTHQLFFLICQLLLCLLTGSLAAVCGMGKGTCQNYTWVLISSTNNLTTDGEYWKMWPLCIESLILTFILHTQHWHMPHGQGKWSLQIGSKLLWTWGWSQQSHICFQTHLLWSILILPWTITDVLDS